MTERIHKLIANAGYASRRRAEILIRQGRVTVDGAPAHIGQRVDPATAQIQIDGVPLPVRSDLVYLLVYKPTGVISTAEDPHGRPIVVDLVESPERVYPVGRLDADSEGLLLLTNDGELTHLLTHPRFGIEKTYTALVEGRVSPEAVRRLVSGVELDDGPAAAVRAKIIDTRGDRTLLEIVMTEGRNREVRRMGDAIGHPVLRLVRTAIGPIRDAKLPSGQSRPLDLDEVRALYAAAVRPDESR